MLKHFGNSKHYWMLLQTEENYQMMLIKEQLLEVTPLHAWLRTLNIEFKNFRKMLLLF
jgi:hypothetical protein